VRPWQHAIASAMLLGRERGEAADWSSFLPLHEFLDLSKTGCADRRHRIMLHHCDLGAEIACQAFPDLADCAGLVTQHVREDLGREARLADWLERVDFAAMPKPVIRRIREGPEGIARMVLSRMAAQGDGASPASQAETAALKVASFLFAPLRHSPDAPPEALAILMNSVGPALVRRVFGPPRIAQVGQRRVTTDWGWLAEAAIMASFGRIPELGEVVRCVVEEPVLRARQRVACT